MQPCSTYLLQKSCSCHMQRRSLTYQCREFQHSKYSWYRDTEHWIWGWRQFHLEFAERWRSVWSCMLPYRCITKIIISHLTSTWYEHFTCTWRLRIHILLGLTRQHWWKYYLQWSLAHLMGMLMCGQRQNISGTYWHEILLSYIVWFDRWLQHPLSVDMELYQSQPRHTESG